MESTAVKCRWLMMDSWQRKRGMEI